MAAEYLLCIATGILIGWATKAPFLFKLYEEDKKLHESIKKSIDAHLKLIEERDRR